MAATGSFCALHTIGFWLVGVGIIFGGESCVWLLKFQNVKDCDVIGRLTGTAKYRLVTSSKNF
jgi:hypothetical protein